MTDGGDSGHWLMLAAGGAVGFTLGVLVTVAMGM